MISFDDFIKQDDFDKYNMLQEFNAYLKSKDIEIKRLNDIINYIENVFYGRAKYTLPTDIIEISTFFKKIKDLESKNLL